MRGHIMVSINVRPDNRLTIIGEIPAILKDTLKRKYGIIKDGEVFVGKFDNESELKEAVSTITRLFNKRNIPLDKDGETDKLCEDVFEEQKRFQQFTALAKEIRDNHCNIEDFNKFQNIVSISLSRTLKDYQLLSAYHLAFSQNACNFSVPGAGKTTIVYAAYSYLKQCEDSLRKVDSVVVVGPLSSFQPWENEYESCFQEKPTVKRIDGSISNVERSHYLRSIKHCDLTLISYHTLPSLNEDDLKFFFNQQHPMVIIDEAHRIKNTDDGVQAQAVLKIAPLCRSRVVLTGTPIPQGYEDLYNYFKFIWPQHNVIGFNVGVLKNMTDRADMDSPAVINLHNNIKPFYMRTRKSDLKLPPIREETIYVPMGEIQRRIYDYIEFRCMSKLKGGSQSYLRSQLARAKAIRLMQSASNPTLLSRTLELDSPGDTKDNVVDEDWLNDNEISFLIKSYAQTEIPAKFEKCLEIVEKIVRAGEKVIIWVNYIGTAENLTKYLTDHGIVSERLDGSVSNSDDDESDNLTREKIIKLFDSPDRTLNVVIANPLAVGESISLHHYCHNAIYLERNYVAGLIVQSMDRIHRCGLPDDVITNYYYLISEDSVDEHVNAVLNKKIQRMNDLLEREDIPLMKNLTDEADDDIKSLIEYYVQRKKKL